MSKCRSCGAEIKFIKLKSGKWNPVDTQKHTLIEGDGNEIIVTESGEVVHGRFASINEGYELSYALDITALEKIMLLYVEHTTITLNGYKSMGLQMNITRFYLHILRAESEE